MNMITEISQKTSLTKNTLSSVLDVMVMKGLINRVQNPNNRRQTIISLTGWAEEMHKKYDAISQEMNQMFYSGFSAEEIESFESYLARLVETLTRLDDAR